MEGEVGAQVATPNLVHRTLPSRFREGTPILARKRDLFSSYQPHQRQQFQNPRGIWNPKLWDWDSAGFVGKPSNPGSPCPGTVAATAVPSRVERKEEVSGLNKISQDDEAQDERLRLKLGGSMMSPAEQPVSRPGKRVRAGSPAPHTYPMCQVDHCREDLSSAKDYHRRHKVCEGHSKSTEALVGDQMQRFCQQCSRFHLLSEFDEGKRSCRRRLAGHNRRRRKTQQEDVTSRVSLPGNQDNSGSGKLDIVNLLAALARAQGSANFSSIPDKEQLVQILGNIKSKPLPADFMAKLPVSGSLCQNISEQASPKQQDRLNGNTSSSSTMDLLPVLSGTPPASAPASLAAISKSSQNSYEEKSRLDCEDQATGLNLHEGSTVEFPSVHRKRSNTSFQHFVDDSDGQAQGVQANLPLQLFTCSPEDASPPKLASERKYFSSDSSNPMDDSSPSSSPPVAQKLFPMQTLMETVKHEKLSSRRETNENVEASHMPLQLFRQPNRGVHSHSFQSSLHQHQAGYTSSSGSDHSPSSLNSDAQDRTGRIIFKLFDKDPSHFPVPLRSQIYKWLSRSPAEMESYIRPGCVVLSIYVSMPSAVWKQLEENLLDHVNSLVQNSGSDFWRNGRFLIHTGRQLALHKDGKIHLCKSWRSWKMPELISVSPLAVVSGQETSLLLRGRNLTTPGTKIHCTSMGGYKSEEVSELACQGSLYDEINVGSFKIQDADPCVLGRCFIEVENGFKGNSFPVIIADAPICQELRLLEPEFNEVTTCDMNLEDQAVGFRKRRSREEVLHFLNELGWLFQRKRFLWRLDGPDYTLTRFKFLFTFSVERDCCALVKTLLDMLVERNLGRDGLSRESVETLSEIHLLSKAVERRCRNMVNLLIHYSVIRTHDALDYIFQPNNAGPGGATSLHLAASMSDFDDMVDILTSDPQQIGMHCWNSLLDANGLSPYAYALMRNNHSYNRLVAQKLADRRNGQVSVPIGNEALQKQPMVGQDQRLIPQFEPGSKSCARCAVLSANRIGRRSGSQGLLQQPYIHFMLAIAAVCACLCLFFRALDCDIRLESISHGTT